MIRVADYIPKFIHDVLKVKHIFMLSGGGIMHLTDGVACNKDITPVCVHHEQTASMALEAYSRLTGNFGVGYFTTGPGATNALTGLVGAWLDSVPCLFISGQVKRKESIYNLNIPNLRQFGVQEVNILPIVKSITKYSAIINDPNNIKYHLEKAIHLSKSGRPGPVWLDIPLDVQGALIDPDTLKGFTPPVVDYCKFENIDYGVKIKNVIKMLQTSTRPVILVGQGVRISGAIKEFLKLVENYYIPVVTTYLGIDIIPTNHPQYIGRVGIKGDRAGNLAVQNSDLLIVIGSSLPVAEIGYDYSQFAREAKIIVVDIDLSSHKKNTIKINTLIKQDAKEFIKSISKLIIPIREEWLNKCIHWRTKYPVCLPEYKETDNNINIYHFFDTLSRKMMEKDVMITDAGSSFYAGSQSVFINTGVRYITSGGLATMGYGIPASIGSCVASNNKQVMCITGDGSFQQNIQELQTIVHHNLPIKIFILNNEGYLSIRFTQEKYFENRFIGESPLSGVSFPDSEKIANTYGIKFMRISDNQSLDKLLDEVIKYEGAVICEIIISRNQLIIPTLASERKFDGTMISKPLEDMYPFLPRDEFYKEMIITPIEE